MKFGLYILAGLILMASSGFSQKKGYEPKSYMQSPEFRKKDKKGKTTIVGSKQKSGKKKVKYGFVGSDPSLNVKQPNTRQSIVGGIGKSQSKKNKKGKLIRDKENTYASGKPFKADKIIKSSDPDKKSKKIRGIKFKYEFQGEDPGTRVNKVKEKRVYDVQFRSAYKFNKTGQKRIRNNPPD